jgi:hypothetical protein
MPTVHEKPQESQDPNEQHTEAVKEPAQGVGASQQSVLTPVDPAIYGVSLADTVHAAMPGFVARLIQERKTAFATPTDPTMLAAEVANLGASLSSSVDQALRAFLTSDIDTQRTTPLTIIRNHLAPVTELLHRVGCAHATRDPFDESAFPDDIFAVGPHAWADFGDEVHEAGLRWGAAKAMAHRQRHRSQ